LLIIIIFVKIYRNIFKVLNFEFINSVVFTPFRLHTSEINDIFTDFVIRKISGRLVFVLVRCAAG
jgi:hypothetical protein